MLPIISILPISHCEKLPLELLVRTFSKNVPSGSEGIQSGLLNVALVSKSWNSAALIAKIDWVNREQISIRTLGCTTEEQVNKTFENHLLRHLNLAGLGNLTGNSLKPENLLSLNLTGCRLIKESVLIQILQRSLNVESLILNGLKELSGEEEELQQIFKRLKKLKKLDLSDTQIEILTIPPNLESLNLNKCWQITKIEEIANLSHITDLDLSECRRIKGKTFLEMMQNLPKLIKLSIAELKISPIRLKALQDHTNLEDLSIRECEIPEDTSLTQLLNLFPKLRILDLEDLENTEEELIDLLNSHPTLESINLNGWDSIRGDTLINTEDYPNIKELNLGCWTGIESGLWLDVLEKFPNLTILNLHATLISEVEISSLLSTFPHLKILHLNKRPQISDNAWIEWKVLYPDVEITDGD